MNNHELYNLKLELIKIETNCLKLLSEKLHLSSFTKDIDNISQKASKLRKEINDLL